MQKWDEHGNDLWDLKTKVVDFIVIHQNDNRLRVRVGSRGLIIEWTRVSGITLLVSSSSWLN